MTFRDDHDAALARADALEVEAKRAAAKLAEAEAERDRLRAEVTRMRESQPVKASERTNHDTLRVTVPRERTSLLPMAAIAFALAIPVVMVAFMIRSGDSHETVQAPPAAMRTCEVRSEPAGAELFFVETVTIERVVTPDVAVPIGTTPVSKPAVEWGLYTSGLEKVAGIENHSDAHFELRLEGYAPVRVADPCSGELHRLTPIGSQ